MKIKRHFLKVHRKKSDGSVLLPSGRDLRRPGLDGLRALRKDNTGTDLKQLRRERLAQMSASKAPG